MSGHELLLHLLGGVALLLWATRMVRTGILRAFGGDLRRHIGRATASPWRASLIGLGVAAALQSSTATALLVVSFAGQGLIGLAAALAVMLGADVGSTLVVQILSFDISGFVPLLFILGVAAFMLGRSPAVRQLGRAGIGLGLIVLSLGLIVSASQPLRDGGALPEILALMAGDPILGLLLGALLTWLAHSSVAIVLLLLSLAMAGVLPGELGFALVLGANVGAGLVPLGLTFRSGAAARRIPVGNLLFRTLASFAVLPFIGELPPLFAALEPEPARQLANFHTAFNLALALFFLPFTGWVAALLERWLPDSAAAEGELRPKYLDEGVIDRPAMALASATREVMRMADMVEVMLRKVIGCFAESDSKEITDLSRLDDDVDRLHEAIKLYLTRLTRSPLTEEESRRSVDLIAFTTNLEHIGDIIDKNLLELAAKRHRNKLNFSEPGWRELKDLHGRVLDQMQLAMTVFVTRDIEMARTLLAEKERFRDLERTASENHFARLRQGTVESIETSALHLDILRDLKRINSHLTSVAYPILEASGELRHSRLRIQPGEAAAVEREGAADRPVTGVTAPTPR